MEKKVNKYASLIRIICYILIPICTIGIVQSTISLLYFANQTQVYSYYDTDEFIDLYRNSIYNNVQACYFENENNEYDVRISNLYGVEVFEEQQNRNIYYRTYLKQKNFKFLIIDNKTNTAFTNLELTTKTDSIEKIKNEITGYDYYWNYADNKINTNISNLSLDNLKYNYEFKEIENKYDCKIYTGIETPLKNYDTYYEYYLLYEVASKTQSNKIAIINISVCISVIFACIVLITVYAGKKKGEKEIYLNIIDKIPLEIIIAFGFIILGFSVTLASEISYSDTLIMRFVGLFIIAIFLYIISIISYQTFIKRIKTYTVFKNTIIYRLVKLLVRTTKTIFNNLSLALKIGVVLGILAIVNIILANCDFLGIVLLFVIYAFLFKIGFEYACKIIEIKVAAKQIYEGNTDIRLKEDEYRGILKELCIYINDIANGLTNAVEEALKSQKMKTELITNVSHDIKTPLTSIINYVDLLKKEKMPNQKSEEYLEILDQKSQRLKRLTEDLVEASKASSGNIKLNLEKLDLKELIKQVSGEYEDKFKDKKLELILSIPEEDTSIIADSRYLYRVIENMYSNIVKYALPDSRVYVNIILDKKNIKIELKNISKDKLNISADELMERFVRGESSRNTEGSGLGLSIAQSLTELQNGTFNIYLDGDLFKVTISFER